MVPLIAEELSIGLKNQTTAVNHKPSPLEIRGDIKAYFFVAQIRELDRLVTVGRTLYLLESPKESQIELNAGDVKSQ